MIKLTGRILIAVVLALTPYLAEAVSVQTIAESKTMYLGESITVTLLVNGDEAPSKPNLGNVEDFYTRFASGESIVTEDQRSCAFQYLFVPKRVGELVIPPIGVKADGQKVYSETVKITVLPPEETDRIRLATTLSKTKCFVGEPITLTTTWYVDFQNEVIKAVDLRLPLMRDPRFDVHDPSQPVDDSMSIGLPVSGSRVMAVRGKGVIGGQEFTTISFKKVVVPLKAGRIEIPQATLICATIQAGTRNKRAWNQYPSYFDNDFFDKDLAAKHKKHFTMAQAIELEVVDLPNEGRPVSFSGLVLDSCEISTSVETPTVSLGAPFTLTVKVSAGEYIENIEVPPLSTLPDFDDAFEIPSDRAAGRITDGAKVFTQTLRTKSIDVKAVPPVKLDYFNPVRGTFEVAQSQAIPLTVKESHVVSGADLVESPADDSNLMRNAIGAVLLLLMFLLGSGATLLFVRKREGNIDPAILRTKGAYPAFKKGIDELQKRGPDETADAYDIIEKTLRGYWAQRLQIPPGAFTYTDVANRLATLGVAKETLSNLRGVFDACHAQRFGGGTSANANLLADLVVAEKTIGAIENALERS